MKSSYAVFGLRGTTAGLFSQNVFHGGVRCTWFHPLVLAISIGGFALLAPEIMQDAVR
jgi:hypothetical protein